MSALDLAKALKENTKLFLLGESVIVETKTRSFGFANYFHAHSRIPPNSGYFTSGSPGFLSFSPDISTLPAEILNADWVNKIPSAYEYAQAGASYRRQGSIYDLMYEGGIFQSQYRLRALRTDHLSYFQRLTKVSYRTANPFYNTSTTLSVTVEPKTIALPVGQFFTPWTNVEEPLLENGMSNFNQVELADIDFANIFLQTTYLPDEEEEDHGFGGYVGLSKIINGQEQTPLAELWATTNSGFPWRIQFNSGGRYKVYSARSDHSEIFSEQVTLNRAMAIQGLQKSTTPGQERISLQVQQMNGAWIEIDAINFTIGVPLEVKYVDRDDPAKTWSTAGEPKSLPANQAIYAGKETGDLVSWSLPENIFPGSTFRWSAERKTPASPAVTITGPAGVDKLEWKLNSPLNWKPGTYRIKCSITKDGITTPLEFEQRVGVRTDDVVVVGWIDPVPIVLTPAGVQPGLLSILPSTGVGSGDNEKIKAALLVKHISEVGVGSPFEVDLGPIMIGTNLTTFSAADKAYALRWMFKFGGNSAPDLSFANNITPNLPGVLSIMDQAKLDEFIAKESLTNFKLINHYQVKYLTAPYGNFDPASVTYPVNKKQVWIGSTKDPAKLNTISGAIDWAILIGEGFNGYPRATGVFPGEAGPNNWTRTDTATETKLCNEGRPDAKAMAAFTNLAGTPAVFHIWSSISFFSDISHYSETMSPSTGASLTRAPKPTQFYQGRINTQIYPTYWIYANGKLVGTQSQNPDPAVLIPNTDQCR